MTQYYKATYDDRPVLVRVEQDDHPEDPLTWTDPIQDKRPLFVMSHPNYVLGDKDAVDKGWQLVTEASGFDPNWMEDDLVTFNGEVIHGSRIGMCCYGSVQVLSIPISNHGCPKTLFGSGSPKARSMAGQMMVWNLTISLPTSCTSEGQYFLYFSSDSER